MANNKWKDYLLKSGLPLEYEVLDFLDSKKCISSFEYSYLRPDENLIENEFSFDIDSSYIKDHHFFKLLIECKYRDSSTNWLFLPGEYGGPSELSHTAFLHPCDHFTKTTKFPYRHPELPPIAKPCLKGIELTSDGQNPKTITQAVNQLSYAMAEMIVDDMVHQIEELLATSEVIFYNVPIIVTTANLFRIKENTTIEKIKETENLLDIATKEDCLVLQTKIGKDLQRHNRKLFSEFINERGEEILNKKLKSFNDDIGFVCEVISSNYCPESILVIQHTPDNKAFEKLFELFDDVVSPSKPTHKYLNDEMQRLKELLGKVDKLKPKMK
ncbi:hypothetical protein A4H97_11075 [Niastella yeongjuensis]|uniref:Uncharacterized protein n=1 Tax=Niastella yeongjuensis TaxID=354355 RepID=A0A1V9EBE5_9BACT|nr:hypothetical protein [Niastella yeongjuensis]OQP43448.1 hypothetical protein A4H97_11075 [Niastella yeongjuensis]SEP41570.1 hypothetical protein SAMN05660816_05884 [Niastella yeongjuensis]